MSPPYNRMAPFEVIRKWLPTVMISLTLLGAAYTEYFKEGIQYQIQSYVGTTEIKNELSELKSFIDPPRVVVWDDVHQIGNCTTASCEMFVAFHRTAYGENCGLPSAAFQIREGRSQIIQTSARGFKPVEGTPGGVAVGLDLIIPSFVSKGPQEWRAINTYPSCAFPGEPFPRYSPWWPLTVN